MKGVKVYKAFTTSLLCDILIFVKHKGKNMVKLILATIAYLVIMMFLFMAWAFAIPGNPEAEAAQEGLHALEIIRYVTLIIALIVSGFYGRYAWKKSPTFLLWSVGIMLFLFLNQYMSAIFMSD